MCREEYRERGDVGIGVSVAICCHNSAHVLPETLAHLKKQHGEPDLRWELMVIDNASEDDTTRAAHSHWKENAPAPIRVLHEPRLSLCYARERPFEEARYEVVTFIDDDNWISADWLKIVREIMSGNPEVGAIGSTNRAIADVTSPGWFSRYSEFYAAWASAESPTIPKTVNGA